jgi:hypothetical protein
MADKKTDNTADPAAPAGKPEAEPADKPAKEIGGRGGLDPTRYGDWEKGGLAVDF